MNEAAESPPHRTGAAECDTGTTTAPLGRWYADPLDEGAARRLLAEAERRRQAAARRGARCRICALLELVARFWLGQGEAGARARAQRELRRTAHGRTLVALFLAQLQAARRLEGAHARLAQAFDAARPLFRAADYFHVLERHRQLADLPLGPTPLPAQPLEELLTTARVARRLSGGRRPIPPMDAYDTTG